MITEKIKELLSAHVTAITKLQYPNYAAADLLYQRTKMLANNYFSDRQYNTDLIGIEFNVISTFIENPEFKWSKAQSKLTAITQAMLDDAILSPAPNPTIKYVEDETKIIELNQRLKALSGQYNQIVTEKQAIEFKFLKFRKTVLYLIICSIFSLILWGFNSFIKWQWLSNHPKKIAIYISLQLAIVSALLPIIPTSIKNKRIEFIIAVIGAILCAFLSII